MATFIVSAPAGDYSGKVGNVQFSAGRAVIDEDKNPAELAYCRNAGYLVEDDEHAPKSNPASGSQQADPGAFDPSEHNADEVLAHLESADLEEAERVLDTEAAGKNRKGITSQRDAILDSKKEDDQ